MENLDRVYSYPMRILFDLLDIHEDIYCRGRYQIEVGKRPDGERDLMPLPLAYELYKKGFLVVDNESLRARFEGLFDLVVN